MMADLIYSHLSCRLLTNQMVKKDLHTLGLIACGAKIAAGTFYYFFVEFANETCVPQIGAAASKTCPADETRFKKSYFTAAFLFFGMAFTLLPYYFMRHNKPGVTKVDAKTFINMIVPSLLEFVGQVMFLTGVMYIPMSLSLTLKGARVVFSAFLLVIFLKRKLFAFHWFAVTGTLVGLGVASIPSLMSGGGDKSGSEAAIGICLVLGGEFIRSLRTVVEEKLMKKMKYDPLLVVGLQGLYALALSIPALFVVEHISKDGKPLELLSESWNQFSSSAIVMGMFLTFPVTVPSLFIAGAYVTKLMSAVHNALTTILTNAIVWILAIIVHEIDNTRGKPLVVLSSVQLVGFLIVLASSLVYDAILRIPQWFTYPLDRAAASGAGSSEKSVLGIVSSDSIQEKAESESTNESKQPVA